MDQIVTRRSSMAPNGTAVARMAAAFATEEFKGLRLAFRIRVVVLVMIAIFLLLISPWPQILYSHALMLGFVATGAVALIPARKPASGPAEWTRWLVPLADLALATFALLYPNPFGGEEWLTLPLRLRLDNMLYLVLFVALSTLTYSPRQVMWTGICGALCWIAATLWAISLPGVGFSFEGSSQFKLLSPTQQALAVSNPNKVLGVLVAKQIFLLLVVSGVLAASVWRSRSMVLRQVQVEGERSQLARYFSPNMVEELADADRPLGAVRTETIAVLFADIVGFTGLSEAQPPEAVIALLREFHARMQAIVFAHHGTLDKYLGDGLMATFGTPRPGPRDAANALAAALDMMEAVGAWNMARVKNEDVPIRIGLGLHWGPVVLGDIGDENRLEFATIGDTVNVASRLEHMTRELEATIVASAALVEAVKAAAPPAAADRLLANLVPAPARHVRGRSGEVALFVRPRSVDVS
jgi:adenylate cyclase